VLGLSRAIRFYVVAGPTDMRKSFNGLSAVVENHLDQDPLSGHVFAFCNRRKNRVKLLVWDGSGLWVSAKRLEKGTFAWPQSDAVSVEMSSEEVTLILGGIDLKQTRRRRWYKRALVDELEREKAVENLQATMSSY